MDEWADPSSWENPKRCTRLTHNLLAAANQVFYKPACLELKTIYSSVFLNYLLTVLFYPFLLSIFVPFPFFPPKLTSIDLSLFVEL